MKEIKLFTSSQSSCCGEEVTNNSCCTSETVNETSCCSSPETKVVEASSQIQYNLDLPVAIIGAGPVGLAAAANLALQKVPFIVLESGQNVAHNIRKWQHVHLFSPWQYNIDKVARKLLEKTDWKSPQDDILPTGKELIEQYLEPLSELPVLKKSIQYNSKVVSISRKENDKMKTINREKQPFEIYVESNRGLEIVEARAIIDATGTWGNPNPATSNGVWLSSEKECQEHIEYGIPNIIQNTTRYANKTIAVIGGGHSAINTLLELADLQNKYPRTKLIWILRKKHVSDAFGGEEKDALEARGALGTKIHSLVNAGKVEVYTPFYTMQVKSMDGQLELMGRYNDKVISITDINELIVNAGNRPDFSIEQELRLSIDPATESVEALAPLIDPNLHSCGTVRPHGEAILRQPEQGLYIVGMKSYGRAPTFLMATGYEQVRSITAYLAGDVEASKRVELDLPETGVCSINLNNNESSCC
ncbi:NAD(P)-binding domain-containing protein [Rummeliibacillus sp. G93]|uniref:NAD(P)-binding domain-containing protein n=1 Tax=Rummeliibacillus sp. G93 TaxID=2939494 RepID=UPI00201BE92E|nr:NAD(P)-binding domain-containing protein [Rummeliibacillus sp. G93]UQW97260.1 NAD(P)-binding domain-containing protein [Rummeliibacillus sp. G93]